MDLWISDFNDLTLICFCFLFLFLQMQISLVIKAKWFTISVQFSLSVMSDSLWPHGLQHARLPCLLPTPGAYSNSCPLYWWCHPTISSSVITFSSRLQSPSIRIFSNESVLRIRWPKYWSFIFTISPSNEYSELISFRMDWLYLLAVQGTLESLLQHHSSKDLPLSFAFSVSVKNVFGILIDIAFNL